MASKNKTSAPSARKCAAIWCDRVGHWPYITFVRDAEEWEIHMRRMKTDIPYPDADGRVTTLFRPGLPPICLMTMGDGWRSQPREAVAGLVLHEAVHVYQELRDYMDEQRPGAEFEAYTIQTMFLSLLYVIEQKTGWTL